MQPIERVLIVGGGIAGLSLAVALGQRGIRSEVVELNSHHHVQGVGIVQPGNALRALKTLGLMESCLAEGFPLDDYLMYDDEGDFIARMKLLRIADPNLPAANGMQRPALHKVLTAAAIKSGVRIDLGLSLKKLDQRNDSIDVTLTDGSRKNYDLVVGADGIRSQTRNLLFGEQFDPSYTGQGVWRFSTERFPEVDRQIIYIGMAATLGIVPTSTTQMYMFLVTNAPDNRRIGAAHLAPALHNLLEAFKAPLVKRLRERVCDSARVIYGPIEEIVMPPLWYQGRVLLIGDAAHASAPHITQGAAMAIEDAVVLAELIAQKEPSHVTLAKFMARRYERCKFVQDTSRQIGQYSNIGDPKLYHARNGRMRTIFKDPAPRPHEARMAEPI